MDATRYDELKASGKLPSPKGVAFAITTLLQKEDYRMDELTHLIQSDPATAGRILKFANSPVFGHTRPIVSLPKAVLALGAFRIRDLVLGFSLMQSNRYVECGDFDLPRFWSHSLATAIANQELAGFVQISPEENFTVGLLSGVGELSLAVLFPEEYGNLRRQYSEDMDLLVMEQERFSLDHRELGATLMREWGLPDTLVQAAYYCEAPDASGFADGSRSQSLTLSLHLARKLAGVLLVNDSGRWGRLPEMLTLAARLGIGPVEFAQLADRAVAAWQEWGALLEVQTREIPPFAELVDTTHPLIQQGPQASASPDNPAAPLPMLLISDDQDIRNEFESLYAREGGGLRLGESDADALALVLRDSPQLLVLDLDASWLDVAALCKSIRASAGGRDLFILVLASATEDVRLTQAFESGANDFLIKPCNRGVLELRLRSINRQIHLRAELQRERRSMMRSADQWATTHRRLLTSAMTDPLTKLPNRRNGQDFLAAEWLSAQHGSQSLACLMLDIDHFKRINDQFGHEAGDQVLCQLAVLLGNCLRSEDLAFRYGGEEFAIICPGTGRKMAVQIGERIRKAVEAETFSYLGNAIPVTISVGVGTFRADHRGHDDILREADQALYRAKETGRNRVHA